jgi:hypothetical protein
MRRIISRSIVSFSMCTGGLSRRVSHERHLSTASSFQIGESRGRRMASRGMLASVSQRPHFRLSQPRKTPPDGDHRTGPNSSVRNCALLRTAPIDDTDEY